MFRYSFVHQTCKIYSFSFAKLRKRAPRGLLSLSHSVYSAGKMEANGPISCQILDLRQCGDGAWIEHTGIIAAKDMLMADGILGVPTDTIYGLAGLAQSTKAVETLYDIKGRDFNKAISICVGNVEQIKKWGKVTVSDTLLNSLLPGPVTVVFERTPELNPQLNPSHANVGIRVPDSGFIQALARACEAPLALTSANKSSAQSTLAIEEFRELWPRLAAVYDGGVLGKRGVLGETEPSRQGSTVIDLSHPGYYNIIRAGSAQKETVSTLVAHGLKCLSGKS